MKFLKTTLAIAVGATVAFSAYAESPTLDRIRASGTMNIAYRDASIPFSYLDSSGSPIGFTWELSQKIADQVKKELKLDALNLKPRAVNSGNRIPLMVNGTIDLECGSTTNNSDRGQKVDFSTNYFYTGTRLIVKADSGINSLADMKGKRLVSTTGTTNLQLLQAMNAKDKLGIKIITAKDHDASFLNVQQGMAEAFAMDDILLFGLRANAPKPAMFAVVGESIQVEPYACMVPKNDPEYKAIVDKSIAALMDSGEFTEMYNKWFMNPIPPKNITIDLPMSDALKENLKAHSDAPSL